MSKRSEDQTEQSKYYIGEQLRERMLVHIAKNKRLYPNNSVFIRQAIEEKLDREERK